MHIFGRLTVALALAFPACPAMALDTQPVLRADGTHMLDARFFGVGDGFFMDNDGPKESTWDLSPLQKQKIYEALRYWGELIEPVPGELPAAVNIGTSNQIGNAAGGSALGQVGDVAMTQIQAVLQGHPPGEPNYGSHAVFYMGLMDWDTMDEVMPSQLPRSGHTDVTAVAFHELAHGLGIGASIANLPGTYGTPHFYPVLSVYDLHIRNSKGDAPKPGQAVLCEPCANPITPDSFDLLDNKGYFVGAHVNEVLDGALPGVPLTIVNNGHIDDYMSHLELKNSLMSHQPYRNYTNFMEAELAVMQDLGYTIDRRNFFGFSIYGDDKHIVNDNGFFKRNAAGTSYLPGQYNTATLGLGLHVYGKHNTVVQQADLLSQGAGGAGIRVDGSGNTIIVAPGTQVHANGVNGRGLMFAYGKNHVLVQRGDVQAAGEHGIAASFDFGNNVLSNRDDYRGSFIHTGEGTLQDLGQELDGALIDQFDLTGSLEGNAAAIFISENAWVRQINVMDGASVQGDIYSNYQQFDDQGKLRMTELRFGRLADAQGRATGQADGAFRLDYHGNIQGANIALALDGGATSLNGRHSVQSVAVAPAATLGGNGRYILAAGGALRNDGTVAPGPGPGAMGRMQIRGDYIQGPTGRLLMKVDGQGLHDTLLATGRATLDGRLSLLALPGWYANGWRLTSDALVQAGMRYGSFAAIDARLDSPTLRFHATPLPDGDSALTITRSRDAYSRYARDGNGRQVGRALDRMASVARTDAQALFSAIDFSALDGSTVRSALSQLSPSAYSSLFASSLHRERQITDIVNADRYTPVQENADTRAWQAFVVPFGGKAWQDGGSERVAYDATSYGVVAGIEMRRPRQQAWTSGIHAAVSEQKAKPRDAAGSKGTLTALELGAHLNYAADRSAGIYAFGQGRIGVEQGSFNRQLRINGYEAKHHSDWNGFTGTLQAGVGYRWALSPAVSVGPLAALEYSYLKRPGVTESGRAATRLELDSSHIHALQSSLGFGGDIRLSQKDASLLKANLQVSWDHELLDGDAVQRAAFAAYPGIQAESRNKLSARDALGLHGGLTYQTQSGFKLGASLSSQWFSGGDKALTGNLSASWQF